MRVQLRIFVFVGVFLVLVPFPASAQKLVTNADVVAMAKAGLSEDIIIGAIQRGPAKFDVSTDALIELKNQHVPEKAIQAMIEAGSPQRASTLQAKGGAADLTREQAMEMLVKAAAQEVPATKITLSRDQIQRLKNLPADPNAAKKKGGLFGKIMNSAGIAPQTVQNLEKVFDLVEAASPTQSAMFVDGGQWCTPPGFFGPGGLVYSQCEHYITTGITGDNPGILMLLKTPIRWKVKEITGISTTPSQKIVDFTWQRDLSSWPEAFQTAVNQPSQTSKAMFALYDDGWRVTVTSLVGSL